MSQAYILAVDQSTQGTKAMLLDGQGAFILRRDLPHRQLISERGWVGHDVSEIAENIFRVCAMVIRDSGIDAGAIAAVAVTNQRESVCVWEADSGTPINESIVWQCSRAAELCDRVSTPEVQKLAKERTGLPLSPFFSGPKVSWLLENTPGAREKAEKGLLRLGTMDTWTIWQMTNGAVHKTDTSNASRTQLFDIHTLRWDEDLCALYGIPQSMLPQVESSDALFGETDLRGLLPRAVPIHADIGDSNGVLFSHFCTEPGDAMCGFGTGSSVMINTGREPVASQNGMNTSIGWRVGGESVYILEGVANNSGSVITWLKDSAGLIDDPRETAALAKQAAPLDRTYMVPSFTGYGAPYWRSEARAAFLGMSRVTGRAELVRAALESVAYQIIDLVLCAGKDSGLPLRELRVAGGPTRNDYLMQFVSDILRCDVVVAAHEELSGIGSAYIAGLSMGMYDHETLRKNARGTVFSPQMDAAQAQERLDGWHHAVESVLGY